MDDASGEATEEDDVNDRHRRGESETGMRLTERRRELIPDSRDKVMHIKRIYYS